MAFVGQAYKVYYIAKNFTSGLTDVKMVVYKPNGNKQGVYDLIEVDTGDGLGIYVYEYSDSDSEGTYLFVVNSATKSRRDAKQVYFTEKSTIGWTNPERKQIRSALGVVGDKVAAVGGQLQLMQTDIDFIKSISGGKWHILGSEMIFYKDDNTTEVARFRLYNDAGIPAPTGTVRRERL